MSVSKFLVGVLTLSSPPSKRGQRLPTRCTASLPVSATCRYLVFDSILDPGAVFGLPNHNQALGITKMAGTQNERSDKVLNEKWDVVLSNGLVKAGLGFGVGVVTSVLLFRRRAWPVVFGTGFGAGMGWSEGDAIFQNAYAADLAAGKRSFKA